MNHELQLNACHNTYHRAADGTWSYSWGEPVPGARDFTIDQALSLQLPGHDGIDPSPHELTAEDVEWATGLCGVSEPLMVTRADGSQQLVVGLTAPELDVVAMLTVADIGDLADVSKATVDSYRYRGYLPGPQIIKGRTPLWARPVVRHWLEHRPGAGWRTDVYGTRERITPPRTMPITRAREVRA